MSTPPLSIGRQSDGTVSFAQFPSSTTVHVLRGELHTISHTLGDEAVTIAGWLHGRQWALCGVRGPQGTQHGLSEFDDDLLCRRCYHAAAKLLDTTDELYEHPVPQEADA